VVTYAAYLAKMVWPVDLAVFYPHPLGFPPVASFLLALLAMVAITAVAILNVRRFPYLFVGWFWYLGTLVPVIGIVQVGMQSMADRYTYVPSIGIFVMGVWAAAAVMDRWRVPPAVRWVAVVGILGALAAISVRQLSFWSSSETLFEHALEATDADVNYVANQQLAVILLESGRPEQALKHFTRAMAIAQQAQEPREGATQALLALGRAREAAMQYRGLLEIHPTDSAVANNLAWLLATSTDPQVRNGPEAVDLAEKAVKSPGGHNARFLDTLAAAYAEVGRFEEAIATAQEARNLAKSAFENRLAEEIARRLDVYQARRAIRE